MSTKNTFLIIAMCVARVANAQAPAARIANGNSVEQVSALHASPRPGAHPQLRSAALHEFFIYHYPTQELPVVDDFSIDRTQHLDAQSTSANTTLNATYYHLMVGGSHAPSLKFSRDSTFHYVVDTIHVDSTFHDTILSKVPNPSTFVHISNISTYPVVGGDTLVWPAYNVSDTIFNSLTDTAYQVPLQLVQDSLMVYDVSVGTDIYTNPNGSPRPLILWKEDQAFVNGTYGLDPPSIGVCTFDGMDRTGYPYDAQFPNNHGIADSLTSVPINLQYPTSDSVYLSFFIQPRGFSGDDQIQTNDSLILEFYSHNDTAWIEQRAFTYSDVVPFKQIMVPIKDSRFLVNNFQLRFLNQATLGGAVDQWNLDYLRIGLNRSFSDTILQDVAYVYPVNSLLAPYTSVPFAKFTQDPASYMADTIGLFQKNLDVVSKFITWGYTETNDCGQSAAFNNYGNNITNNADSMFNTIHPVNSAPNNFTYNVSGCTNAAYATVKFWTNATPDVCQYNDSTIFTQQLSDYYSYDDGSAEAGYWLNSAGAQLAYRFDTQGDDSLVSVRMYFDPIFPEGNPTLGSFLITVWGADLNAAPIFQNVSFSKPAYVRWGPDHFVEYALDSTIHVSGTFYVGWVQTNSVKMNLGLDKNRIHNDRMFYNVSNSWVQSQAQGSWMIRPVMVSAVHPFAGVDERSAANDVMRIFPNPSSDEVWIRMGDGSTPKNIEVMDATGRAVMRSAFHANEALSLALLSPGLYVVRALDADGRALGQQRLIIQR